MAQQIRIQKVLSDNGVLSRRKAEEAIQKGIVTVNGRKATIGQKIDPIKDLVAINGENLSLRKNIDKVYIMLNKPRGYVTTMSDELGRKCVADLVKDTTKKVYPIGRLDKNSEGLLLMTNDGDFANFIMHPSHHIAKTYRVTVRPDVTEEKIITLASGVIVDGVKTSPAIVNVLEKESGRVVLLMTIYEGKNRQIRKMCESVGLEVARLKRMSIGPIKLGMLQPGKWRELSASEVIAIKNSAKKATNKENSERERRTSKNKRNFTKREIKTTRKGRH